MLIFIFCVFFVGASSAERIYYDHAIQRPCPDLNPNCIRNVVAQASHCQPTHGEQNQKFHLKYLPIPMPHVNLTFTWQDAEIKGMENWKITEFYVNRKTKNIVLEVSLNNVVTTGDHTQIKYYLKAREPVTLSGFFSFTYTNMLITATIPYDPVKGILWSRADFFAYHPVDDAPYLTSSSLVNSDPDIHEAYYELLHNIALGMKEASPTAGPVYFKLFFDNYFCKV